MKTHLRTSGFANDSNGNMASFPTSSGTQRLSYDVENRTGGAWFDLECQPLDRGGTWTLYGAHGERLETVSISAAVANITDRNYFGASPPLNTNDSIYERYSNGGSPALLNTIYLNQMGGGLLPRSPKQVNFSRCTK